jgi:hypothetical protein
MVKVYKLKKKIPDNKIDRLGNTFVKPNQIDLIINHDADVYNEEGKILLKFRKQKLKKHNIDSFYDNVVPFMLKHPTQTRGSTTGSKNKHVRTNPSVYSTIVGYFDRWGPSHKVTFKRNNLKKQPLEIRETMFSEQYPQKFKKLIPLIKEIDVLYKKYIPDRYAKQIRKARQTYFKIPNTSFTTVTTNLNFKTAIHRDKGDDIEGFGNLAVIEKGKYKGAETCLPQYGVGVNVRSGDILYMDVHQWHGNLPMIPIDKDAKRLSIVCYLRKNLWLRSKGKSKSFMNKHIMFIRKLKTKKKKPV